MDKLIDCYHELCFDRDIVPPGTTWIRGQLQRRMPERHISFIQPHTFCEYCHDLKDLSAREELTEEEEARLRECQEHVRIRDEQRKQYGEEVKALENGESEWGEIWNMDFSKIQGDNCTFIHDMIIVVYQRDLNTGRLHHFYRHYVAESSSITNDTGFMKAALNRAIKGESMHNIESYYWIEFATSDNIKMWSDGGSKHFKNSHVLFAIAQLVKKHEVSCHLLWSV